MPGQARAPLVRGDGSVERDAAPFELLHQEVELGEGLLVRHGADVVRVRLAHEIGSSYIRSPQFVTGFHAAR